MIWWLILQCLLECVILFLRYLEEAEEGDCLWYLTSLREVQRRYILQDERPNRVVGVLDSVHIVPETPDGANPFRIDSVHFLDVHIA